MSDKNNDINYPKIDASKLLKIIPNRFLLSSAISKRARQIMEGDKPRVDYIPEEPFDAVGLAMKELLEGKFEIEIKEQVDDEEELIEKLDKSLDAKLEKEVQKKDKDKKPKSKSLSTF